MQDSIFDPSSNLFHRYPQPLDYLFSPRSVAIIGATERPKSVGRTLLWNLLRSPFGGTIYPVNPKRKNVLGVKAYPSILDIPEKVDLAVIVTPAHSVPHVIQDCVKAKVVCAIIISAGFREIGEEGIKLEKEILKYAKNGNLRIVGPNCLGVMNPISGLNATFAADIALKGNIAFLSQSGALCTAVLDWSLKEKLGFSAFVSIGSMMDVGWGDFINYFGHDPNTESILIYMESIDNPRAFLSAAREVSLSKPIILIKAGRTIESAKAATSHTGALVGSDEIFDVALQRAGVLRVDTISELFSMTEIFAKQPKPKAPKLAIITNAGGPGVIATDALIRQQGQLAALSDETIKALNEVLPTAWSHNNPIDVLGDADAERYENAISVAIKDKDVEGVLVILTPQYMTEPVAIAEKLVKIAKQNKKKPILASWMGAKAVEKANELLVNANIPTFSFPDEACKIFAYMWAYTNNLRLLYETPLLEEEKNFNIRATEIDELISSAKENNKLILSEYESKRILHNYGIDVVETEMAKSSAEAIALANKIGYPIVLKLHSNVITHKAAAGGVKLNLKNDVEVEKAYNDIKESAQKIDEHGFDGVTVQKMVKNEDGCEIIIGSYVDEQFGPIIIFGSGGSMVEVYNDKALALAPLNSTLARRMMEKTKIFQMLKKNKKIVAQLERLLTRFSNMIIEYPSIMECDINPLIISKQEVVALDVRFILAPSDVVLTKPAICPYPAKYIAMIDLKGVRGAIRPIHPEDEPLVVQFFKDLSKESLHQGYLRELSSTQLISHENMIKICFNDYEREISMIAIDENKEIMGIGKITKMVNDNDATFAIVIKDKWQGRGLGAKLLNALLDIAKDRGYHMLKAFMFVNNERMISLCKKMGFSLASVKGGKYVKATLKIHQSS